MSCLNQFKSGIEMEIVNSANMLQPLDTQSLWLENDLTIFFGPSGVGKSIFAVQTAIDVIKKTGEPVLYLDFELSEREFMQRFSRDYLGELFYRAAPDAEELLTLNARKITDLVIKAYKERHFKYFIIDNISIVLDDAMNYDKAKRFVLKFKSVVDKFPEISIMLVGHTPKRDSSLPTSADNLAGSKALTNFVKSVFAIMPSIKGKDIVYVKQLKARNNVLRYGDDNVLVYERKKEGNILLFKKIGESKEVEHLFNEKNRETKQKMQRNSQIIALHKDGNSLSAIQDILKTKGEEISRTMISKIIQKKL